MALVVNAKSENARKRVNLPFLFLCISADTLRGKKVNHKLNLKAATLVLLLLVITVNIFVNISSVYAVDWSPDMRITWNAADDFSPSVSQARDGKIWVVWQTYRTGDYEIFHKVYDPNKVNPWSADTRLTQSAGIDISPSVLYTADNKTWVAWSSRRTGNFEIYYKVYDGTSWTIDMKLTDNPSDDDFPFLMQTASGTIWLFWSSTRTGNGDIFYKTSSDNGTSWTSEQQLISGSETDASPSVTQANDGKIWLVWERDRAIYYEIYDGASWSSAQLVDTPPSNTNDMHPSIAQNADGNMWVVFDSDRINNPDGDPQNDIFCKTYSGTWSGLVQLTTDANDDDTPSIIRTNDGILRVTWAAARSGLHDIYYRTNSVSPLHDVAIFYVEASKSMVALDHTVSIEVVAQNHGTSTETFSINLFANTTLIGSRQITDLIPGDLYRTSFDWKTSGYALGTYDIMSNTTVVEGETNTADNTYVDGKVTVVIHDIAVLSVTSVEAIAYYLHYRNVFVDVRNEGTVSEDVTVAAHCNSTELGVQTVFLEPGATMRLWFYIFDVPYGNYTISAQVYPVLDEDHQADNYREGGTVLVTIPGDVNGDKTIDILDVSGISAHWYPGPPEGPLGYELSFDINEDGAVDILEVAILSAHWGETW